MVFDMKQAVRHSSGEKWEHFRLSLCGNISFVSILLPEGKKSISYRDALLCRAGREQRSKSEQSHKRETVNQASEPQPTHLSAQSFYRK